MVQLKSTVLLALAASIASAQSLLTPITYEGTIDAYYYFQNSDAIAVLGAEGITVEGTFGSTEELCQTLNNGQIVYSISSSSNVLLTSNCYNVFHLVDSQNQLIDWDSCEEFPFYQSLCGELETSTPVSTTQSTTATAAPAAQTSTNESETLVLSTVTTTIKDVVTTYTTWCPLTEESTATKAPAAKTASEDAYTTITSVYTKNGVASTSTGSAIVGSPNKATVSNVEEYKSSHPTKTEAAPAPAAVTTKTEAAPAPAAVTTKTEAAPAAATTKNAENTVLVAGGKDTTETVIIQQQASTTASPAPKGSSTTFAISTFQGQAGKMTTSLSVIYIIGTIAAFFL